MNCRPAKQAIPGHAFLHSSGSLQDLGTLGAGTYSYANAINDAGVIAAVAGKCLGGRSGRRMQTGRR